MIQPMVRPWWEVLVMSDNVILDRSNGSQTDMHFDDAEGTYVFNTHEQATPLLDENKRKYNEYGD